jgi:hypothetical protein
MSNLVFSVKSKFKASELENNFQVDVEGISDEQILHSAVGILRRDIEKLKISVEDYPKSQSTSRLLREDMLCIFQVIVSSEKPFCERLNHR